MLRRLVFLLLLSGSPVLAQSTFITGTLAPYANGFVVESASGNSANINGQGFFKIPVTNTPNHTLTLTPNGSTFSPFSVSVVVAINQTTDVSTTLLQNMPIPNPFPVQALQVKTAYLSINGLQYIWPTTQVPGCLLNDGNGNISWSNSGCGSGSGATIQHTTNLIAGDNSGNGVSSGVAVSSLALLSSNKTFYQRFLVDSFPSTCTVSSVGYTTQSDCAWATALAYVTVNDLDALLVYGTNYYPKNIAYVEPTGTVGHTVNLQGAGIHATYLVQNTTIAGEMIQNPNQSGNLSTIHISDMTFIATSGGQTAQGCGLLVDVIQGVLRNVDCTNVPDGADHFWQIGASGRQAQEMVLDHVFASGLGIGGTLAQATATCCTTGDVSAVNLTSGGTGYPSSDLVVNFTGTGAGDKPCTTNPVWTATQSGGIITGFTKSSSGVGCVAPVYVSVQPRSNVNYGFKLYMSDSTCKDCYAQGVKYGFDAEYGNTSFYHPHAVNSLIGIRSIGNNVIDSMECDELAQECVDLEGTLEPTITNTNSYTALGQTGFPGYVAFHFYSSAGPALITNTGNMCGGASAPAPGYHEFTWQFGPYETSGRLPSGTVVAANDSACGTPIGDIFTPKVTFNNLLAVNGLLCTPGSIQCVNNLGTITFIGPVVTPSTTALTTPWTLSTASGYNSINSTSAGATPTGSNHGIAFYNGGVPSTAAQSIEGVMSTYQSGNSGFMVNVDLAGDGYLWSGSTIQRWSAGTSAAFLTFGCPNPSSGDDIMLSTTAAGVITCADLSKGTSASVTDTTVTGGYAGFLVDNGFGTTYVLSAHPSYGTLGLVTFAGVTVNNSAVSTQWNFAPTSHATAAVTGNYSIGVDSIATGYVETPATGPGTGVMYGTASGTKVARTYVPWPWSCQPGYGDGTNAVAAATYLQTNCYNDTGQTLTLTGIKCFTDNNGTSSLAITNGAGTALLTSSLTCTTAFAAGTQSGTTTIASGDFLKITFVADGTTKQANFVITGNHP